MKFAHLIIFSIFLGFTGLAQNSNDREPFFEMPTHFPNDFGYNLIVAKGYFGLIDSNGVVICEPAYDWINNFKGDFAVVDLNGKKGIINKYGKAITPVKYNKINDYRNYWAMGSVKNKWFYIDTNGNELQGLGQHPNFHDFKNGPKLIRIKNGVKYVNEQGEVVIDDGYTRGAPFINGYTIVNKDKKQYLIDTLGKLIQTIEYDNAGVALNGLYVHVFNDKKKGIVDLSGKEVIPCEYDEIKIQKDGIIQVKKDYKWGAYNCDFELIIPIIYDRIDYLGFDITRNRKVMVTDGQYKGLIDFDGKTIKECIYGHIMINEDLTIITIKYPALDPSSSYQSDEQKKKNFNEYLKNPEINRYQISDKNGIPLLDRKYYFAKQVHENYFMVADLVGMYIPYRFHRGHRDRGDPPDEIFMNASLIDVRTGEIVFENYTDYSYVKDGVFACRDTNAIRRGYYSGGFGGIRIDAMIEADLKPVTPLWKLIHLNGNEISIPKKFEVIDVGPFGLQVRRKVIGKDKFLRGMLDFDGNVAIPVKYDEITQFLGSSFKLKKDGLFGIGNTIAKTAGPCRYDYITNKLRLSGMFYVEAKRKIGYIDALGNEMIPCIYDSKRDDFRYGRLRVTIDRDSFRIYKNGERFIY